MYSQQFKDQIECFANSLERKANDIMFNITAFTSTKDRVERIARANRRYEQATHLRRTFINPPTLHLPEDIAANFRLCHEETLSELYHALAKFPTFPIDALHCVSIIGEEYGELVRASVQCTYENGSPDCIRNELIQTIAMCYRLFNAIESRESMCIRSAQI